MIKLLIVDDEPLVQVGIKSMLDWEAFDIEICGTAFNGQQALTMIESLQPDIVLSDIKMPIMTGIELLRATRDRYESLPLFIFLTSYEEFSLIKEAIRLEALDYLIKLDITPESLTDVIRKALKKLEGLKQQNTMNPSGGIQHFYERFMMRLLNDLFDSEEQLTRQAKELSIDFSGESYTVCQCTITDFVNAPMPREKLINLYMSATQMANNLMNKHLVSYITSFDMQRFSIVVSFNSTDEENNNALLDNALKTCMDMLKNYFNISLYISVGRSYDKPIHISSAYQDARQLHPLCSPTAPIQFYESNREVNSKLHTTFHLGLFKTDIQLAFESFDQNSFDKTLTNLMAIFIAQPKMFLQAMDASSNLLYLTLSMLPHSDKALGEAFSNQSEGYRCLYGYTRIEQVIKWLEVFKTAISELLGTQHKTFKNSMIQNVRDYIDKNIDQKLSLADTASLFSISPNYLSILFKKTVGLGFNEYITNKKIALAKARLLEGNVMVYEVAEELGFESAFYFSKVFKKVVGMSPSAYVDDAKSN